MTPIRFVHSTDILEPESSSQRWVFGVQNPRNSRLKTRETLETLDLDVAQLIERYVATHEMARLDLGECRLCARAEVLHTASGHTRATRVQHTSRWWVRRARNNTGERNALTD